MNVWKLTAAGNLVRSEEELRIEEGRRRVRVTKVYLTGEDAAVVSGRRRVKYPFVPGRYAVGLLVDEGTSPLFPKGARVLLHSYLPAEDTGVEEKDFSEDDYRIAGQTADGFMRDFVYAREDEMTVLPESVSDEKALLLSHIALAQATIDTLDVKRGEHIAVIGADILGFFVARLLIYRQAAPILIDSDEARLEFARARGVYYTTLADGHCMEMVGTVTGGRLADGAVYVANAGADIRLPLSVCAAGKHVAFCGLGADNLSLDASEIINKQLTVHGVADGTENLEMAVNLIANKAVDLSAFKLRHYSAAQTETLFKELSGGSAVDEINILNLV